VELGVGENALAELRQGRGARDLLKSCGVSDPNASFGCETRMAGSISN
jgi:hypothetical protein